MYKAIIRGTLAFAMYRNEVTLPLHTLLTDEQVEFLLETFAQLLRD